jgi:hypothetical protein
LFFNTFSKSSISRPVVARRPTEEEIEKMATQFENKRLSGEAGELKEQLHSGEIVHENVCL